eukprot:1995681-Prymnesium_polylepis.1
MVTLTAAVAAASLKMGSGGGANGLPAGGVGGRRSSASRKPSHLAGVAPEAMQFASYADMLLPMCPPKSQFTFELENPLHMHSPHEYDRRLQRRLAMIAQLQAET